MYNLNELHLSYNPVTTLAIGTRVLACGRKTVSLPLFCPNFLPSFVKNHSAEYDKGQTMRQRDPAPPAFVLQTLALAHDIAQCQGPACLSINLIDSARDMRQDDSAQNQ